MPVGCTPGKICVVRLECLCKVLEKFLSWCAPIRHTYWTKHIWKYRKIWLFQTQRISNFYILEDTNNHTELNDTNVKCHMASYMVIFSLRFGPYIVWVLLTCPILNLFFCEFAPFFYPFLWKYFFDNQNLKVWSF